tara:strand:+ start:20988 stop:21242 length:255 start_codon:yes stop_codon:yes gene_type:complete
VLGLDVSGQMHAYRDDRLKALWARHIWDAWARLRRWWIEQEHAQSDERVAEEYGDGEEHHDEKNVNFLAEVAVCEGNCEVCGAC